MQKISAFCLLFLVCLTSAQISISPSSINFGDVQVGQTAEKVVYIINVGDEPVTMSGVGGGVDEPFEVQQDCQDNLIAPGQLCRMYFYFSSARAKGYFYAISQGTWNNYPFSITLTASAVAPELNIAPTSLDFGIVPVGEIVQKTVYITNTGDASVTLSGVGGGLAAPFEVSQNCQDNLLSPGDSCEMIFTFTPTTIGSATAFSSGTWNGQPYTIKVTANTDEIVA